MKLSNAQLKYITINEKSIQILVYKIISLFIRIPWKVEILRKFKIKDYDTCIF